MKKLLKLLFISTMATIPLASSIVITACNFSMGDTLITIEGLMNQNIILLDAQNPPNLGEDEVAQSLRRKNKEITIKIKNPLKGYKLAWTIENNKVIVQEDGVEKQNNLIAIREIKNDPGESLVQLDVKTTSFLDVTLKNVTINFTYYNESKNSTIVPDIKNKSMTVQVHQIEVRENKNEIDINKMNIKESYEYDFSKFGAQEDQKDRPELFLNNYIKNFIDHKINLINSKKYNFLIGNDYSIFVSDKSLGDVNGVNELICKFLTETNQELIVRVETEKNENNREEGKYIALGKKSYVLKNNKGKPKAPVFPGGTSPDTSVKYDLSDQNLIIEDLKFNFKKSNGEMQKEFATNYVKNYFNDRIFEWSNGDINSEKDYLVQLDIEDIDKFKNYWEDDDQQKIGDSFIDEKSEKSELKFKIIPKNLNKNITVSGVKEVKFIQDDEGEIPPTIPGMQSTDKWIDVRFNTLFDKAIIDLSGITGNTNGGTTILKEGLGGLVLEFPIALSGFADIKTAVSQSFDVFFHEITKDETINAHIKDKETGIIEFDRPDKTLRDKFIEIIKNKSNWTINWWEHTGTVGTVFPDKEKIADHKFDNNQVSTMSYSLTTKAKEELKNINILAFTDSFQFPMYIQVPAKPDKSWNNYFGHEVFKNYYGNEYNGLIIGNKTEFLSSTPGEIIDPKLIPQKSAYDNVLTQQAIALFAEGGTPNNDQNFYVSSGADYSIGVKDSNKNFKFTLEQSDVFKDQAGTQSSGNMRTIYGNDIVKKTISSWVAYRYSKDFDYNNKNQVINKIDQNYEEYEVLKSDGEKAVPIKMKKSIGNDKAEKAYFLDLTNPDSKFEFKLGEWGHDISFREILEGDIRKLHFYKSLTGNETGIVEKKEFLDSNNKVGVTKEQEEKWLEWNIINQTNKLRPNKTTMSIDLLKGVPLLKDDFEFECEQTPDKIQYLYFNMGDSATSSELTDKSIQNIIIKLKIK